MHLFVSDIGHKKIEAHCFEFSIELSYERDRFCKNDDSREKKNFKKQNIGVKIDVVMNVTLFFEKIMRK